MIKRLLIYIFFALATTACIPKITLNGAAIDYNVYKTLNIGQFPIRAAMVYAPLEPMFENALHDTYTKQTRLKIIDSANTDLSVEAR